MKLVQIRYAYTPRGTLSRLPLPDGTMLHLLEEPWIPNPAGPGGSALVPGVSLASCIPDGTYQLVPHDTLKHPHVWRLVNHDLGVYGQPDEKPAGQEWGRVACLWHVGNTLKDIEGCAAVGTEAAIDNDEHCVYHSGKAIDILRALLGTTETHEVEIRPIRGTDEP